MLHFLLMFSEVKGLMTFYNITCLHAKMCINNRWKPQPVFCY